MRYLYQRIAGGDLFPVLQVHTGGAVMYINIGLCSADHTEVMHLAEGKTRFRSLLFLSVNEARALKELPKPN